ncbi:hypothetical protein DPPLL_19150 [Desulfofustis limnaeus]|uniref:Uncharacterized protein n=1 Tax=Desulfofustis limnaeus TaxID=2740163 RepID=A0ABM7W9F5_9BACT|nr:hypothetical protein DPPLL_19150 [Desulfofustis limnaeus]
MTVMTAGMHAAGVNRGKRDPGTLLNGQRIHIGPQADSWRLSVRLTDLGDDPGMTDGLAGNADLRQFLSDIGSRPVLFIAQFREAMQMAADVNNPLPQGVVKTVVEPATAIVDCLSIQF